MARKKNKQTKVESDRPIPYFPTASATEKFAALLFDADNRRASGLKDTGARAVSITGAMREPEGADGNVRPRYDLIPAKERAAIMHADIIDFEKIDQALAEILAGDFRGLVSADNLFSGLAVIGATLVRSMGSNVQAWKRLAIHYGRGALKYADRNWEKGLETSRTISSLTNHLQKEHEGRTDEDHLAAALWNTIALMWTVRQILNGDRPSELDTYGVVEVV